MRRNPNDPFDDLFRQLEQFVEDVMQQGWGPGMAGSREPWMGGAGTHVDVHEYDDRIAVIADLPGVEKSAIDLSCDGNVLTITAENENRRYDEHVRLPGTVAPETARAKYNNGVLEVTFERAGGSSSIEVE